jgi:hypothetical protein
MKWVSRGLYDILLGKQMNLDFKPVATQVREERNFPTRYEDKTHNSNCSIWNIMLADCPPPPPQKKRGGGELQE